MRLITPWIRVRCELPRGERLTSDLGVGDSIFFTNPGEDEWFIQVEYEKKGTVVVKIRAGDEYLNAADYDLLSREPVFS